MADKRIVTVDYLESEGLTKGYIYNNFANALKGSKSDTTMLLDDVSPVTHEMGVKVRCKNILPYPFTYATFESYGVTFTDNKDGTITLNGKNDGTSMSNYNLFTTSDKLSFLKPNTDYYLSCNLDNIIRSLRTVKSDGTYNYYSYGNINFSPDETPDRLFIQVKTTDTTTYDNTVVKLQIEEGTTSTAYTPYVPDLTAVKVTRCGKNLLPYPYADSSKSSVGATITVNEDRSISFSGTPTSYIGFILYKGNALVKSGTFTISVGNLTNISTTLFIYDGSGATLKTYSFTKSVTVNADDYPTAATWNITMARAASNQQINGTAYPQIELGTTITEYEPYNGTEYTPNADGTVNGVTSLFPNTTLMTDTEGVIIDCEYNRDINKFSGLTEYVKHTDINQSYDPLSENAQSGKAVAEALLTLYDSTYDTSKIQQDVSFNDGYYWNNTASQSSSYIWCQLDVQKGDIITAYSNNFQESFRFIDAYNGTTRVETACSNSYIKTYTVPSGVDSIYISLSSSNKSIVKLYIERTTETLVFKENVKLNNYVFKNGVWSASADLLSSDIELQIAPEVDNKKNCVYEMYGKFDEFTSVTIAHGKTNYAGSFIIVDNTNIISYYNNGGDPIVMGTYAHGLSVSDFINVRIDVPNDHAFKAVVTVNTNGGQFSQGNVSFGGCRGTTTVSGGQSMTDVVGKYFVRDMYTDVWVFGDSYISLGDPNRWADQFMLLGYKNVLFSGFGGAASLTEIASFRNLIERNSPRIVCWCIGMNDGDTETEVNANWQTVLNEVINTCSEKGIELVLATIPNVPNIRHDYKNEIIRTSGYRYIDFAKAVNAEDVGAEWYSGMLSSDNTHPTQEGAKALASRFLLDVPEITV